MLMRNYVGELSFSIIIQRLSGQISDEKSAGKAFTQEPSFPLTSSPGTTNASWRHPGSPRVSERSEALEL